MSTAFVEDLHEQERRNLEEADVARGRVMTCCVAYCVIAVLHVASFWAAYIWTALLIAGTFATGILGIAHFASLHRLQNNTFCFEPLAAVRVFHRLSLLVVVGGVLSLLTSLLAVLVSETTLVRVFAGVSLVTGACYVVAALFGIVRCRELLKRCEELRSMQPGVEWVAAGATEGQIVVRAADVDLPADDGDGGVQRRSVDRGQHYPHAPVSGHVALSAQRRVVGLGAVDQHPAEVEAVAWNPAIYGDPNVYGYTSSSYNTKTANSTAGGGPTQHRKAR